MVRAHAAVVVSVRVIVVVIVERASVFVLVFVLDVAVAVAMGVRHDGHPPTVAGRAWRSHLEYAAAHGRTTRGCHRPRLAVCHPRKRSSSGRSARSRL
jgi:hypothetical protein